MHKFSKFGCVLFLVSWPALAAAAYQYLPAALGQERLWFAVGSGLLLAIGLNGIWSLLTGNVETREDLVGRSQAARPFADGEAVLVSGRVRAPEQLLTAPLSGAPCVAYFYRMYEIQHRPGGEMDTESEVYWGYASRRFEIDTPSGAMAMEVPRLSVLPSTRRSPRRPRAAADADVVARARDYVDTVRAEPRGPLLMVSGEPALRWMADISPDEEGNARRDWKRKEGGERVELNLSDAERGTRYDPADLNLEEVVLPAAVEVSAHGRWSAARNALSPEPGLGRDGPLVAVGRDSLGAAAGVPGSRLALWITTLVILALGVGLIWFAIHVWPTWK